MFGNWQDIFALSIVAIAVVYVAYTVLRRLRRRDAGACGGGCFGCKQADPDANNLVTSIGTSESMDRMPRNE